MSFKPKYVIVVLLKHSNSEPIKDTFLSPLLKAVCVTFKVKKLHFNSSSAAELFD